MSRNDLSHRPTASLLEAGSTNTSPTRLTPPGALASLSSLRSLEKLSEAGISRRAAVRGLVGAGGLMLAGCDKIAGVLNGLNDSMGFHGMLDRAETLSRDGQRLVLSANAPLAREYKPSDISRVFKANGTTEPDTDEYRKASENNFGDWRLKIDGLVMHPLSLSLDDLKKLPARTQITRHDCVEGWSAIGGWTGVQLSRLLNDAVLLPNARYIVFHCADDLIGRGMGIYYESIDLIDAFHPQTIMAYAMNGQPLPVAYGAPLRLRVERQLGYKMAKYVMRIEAVESLATIHSGHGGFWEDQGYEWYAGI